MGVRATIAIAAAAFLCACATSSTPDSARGHSPQALSIPLQAAPSPDAAVCGDWAQTYAELAAAYGEIRNCIAVDPERSVWVITTVGKAGTHGVIAVYYCPATACRDGSRDHPTSGWHVYAAPFNGGVTVLGRPLPTVLLVSNGGHQIHFDLTTDRYLA